MSSLCSFMEADPEMPDGIVSSPPHDATGYFFVPIPNGGAVRAAVCVEHSRALGKLFPEDA